jgi:putative SbcD/Mre11-related phosphoesterase
MRVHTDWLLTPQRAAIHLPTATAVLADLHLGYDQARRRTGEAVPLVAPEEALAPLAAVVACQAVRRLVIAGDLLESGPGGPLLQCLAAWLQQAGVELVGVVPGNHDRGLGPEGGLRLCPGGIELGEWRVVHGDGPLGPGRLVFGHFHPCLRWGRRIAAPCYLVGDRHLVLPAFSADAAGVNVLGDRRWHAYRCYPVAGARVLDFGEVGSLRRRVAQKQRRKG